jgi:hypothetical protein
LVLAAALKAFKDADHHQKYKGERIAPAFVFAMCNED